MPGAEKGAYCRRHEAQTAHSSRHRLVRGRDCYVFHGIERPGRTVAASSGRRHSSSIKRPLVSASRRSPTDPKNSRLGLPLAFNLAGNTDRFTHTDLDDLTGEFPRAFDRSASQSEEACHAGRLRLPGSARCFARSPAACMSKG